ncbi:hypothetical protein C8A03DRAFT_35531 [Achaetomium macrosporum]|uniref:Uncharacterized protein n=1 Tax=Achaetomium macrosporum TaxID=79813 RepID=A0AAN7C7R9_9PEZI|nr:hypothetical protein C8A03DRAFT_35531 [Achaetomium macrosporum]
MGLPPDENLPEVVEQRPTTGASTLPEVVPDSSPEAAPPRFYYEPDKYPAQYDDAPKLPHDEPSPVMQTPGQQYHQYQQPWPGAANPVSAVSPDSSVPWQSFPTGDGDDRTFVGSGPAPEKRICGLRKRLFIIIAAIVGLVIVVAAIGGGVGGAMAARNSQKSTDEAASAQTASASTSGSSATSTTAITTTTTQSSTSTSSAPTPTMTNLNNQTDPSVFKRFAFQAYEKPNMNGNLTQIYTDEGFFDLKFNATSYIWLPNKTDCCVTFCADKKTFLGYWCDTRRRNETEKGKGFARISIWCGRWTNTDMQKKCS